MKDSLRAKYEAGEMQSRESIDQLLGRGDDGEDSNYSRTFHLENWYGNPWYLRVQFDDAGKVLDLDAHPD